MSTYIIQFIIGGALIAGFSFIANNMGVKQAALFYALPIQFTIHIVLLYIQNKNHNEILVVSKSSIFSLLATILFLIIFILLLQKYDFLPSVIIAYTVFIILLSIYVYFYV